METSQVVLNHGITFLVISTGIMFVLAGGFLIKLLFDLSRLVKNLDETTTIVKAEIEPTLKEFNSALKSISSIAQNADKQVDSLTKFAEGVLGVSVLAFDRAKKFSGGVFKGFVKGLVTVIKLFLK